MLILIVVIHVDSIIIIPVIIVIWLLISYSIIIIQVYCMYDWIGRVDYACMFIVAWIVKIRALMVESWVDYNCLS